MNACAQGARLQRDVDQMDEQRKELESLRTKVERLQVRDQLRVEEVGGEYVFGLWADHVVPDPAICLLVGPIQSG